MIGISPESLTDQTEVSRLREEVEVLRSELQRAEVELEDKCWMASPVLQHWLQLTYEMESASYNAKRKAAEEQLAQAKDMCDKVWFQTVRARSNQILRGPDRYKIIDLPRG